MFAGTLRVILHTGLGLVAAIWGYHIWAIGGQWSANGLILFGEALYAGAWVYAGWCFVWPVSHIKALVSA